MGRARAGDKQRILDRECRSCHKGMHVPKGAKRPGIQDKGYWTNGELI